MMPSETLPNIEQICDNHGIALFATIYRIVAFDALSPDFYLALVAVGSIKARFNTQCIPI